MNTARIVVLAIAVGAGGIAANPANGSDHEFLQNAAAAVARARTGHRAPGRGESMVVRFGAASSTTQQEPKGRLT